MSIVLVARIQRCGYCGTALREGGEFCSTAHRTNVLGRARRWAERDRAEQRGWKAAHHALRSVRHWLQTKGGD